MEDHYLKPDPKFVYPEWLAAENRELFRSMHECSRGCHVFPSHDSHKCQCGERERTYLADSDDDDPDLRPSISVHELRGWFVSYALKHEGTEREKIADELADFIDAERALRPK